jgi:predicted PurR-regulated permease PerM
VAEARRVIDIAPAAIAKVIAAVVLVWLWLHIWQLVMLVIVSIVIANGHEPAVELLQRRRVPRAVGASGSVALLTLLIVGFFMITGASLGRQAKDVGARIGEIQQDIGDKLPSRVRDSLFRAGGALNVADLATHLVNAGRLVVSAAIVAILVLILTVYLLIEGRRTYTWLVAYAPPAHRARVDVTARAARKAIHGYVVGNVATSVFAAVVVFVALSLLHVPAALLLAVLAGIFDFVPVLGFICSALPAVALGLTVSVAVGVAVVAIYGAYHLAENYYIGPKVYGDQLKLSNLAVIIAFAVGAEIGGIAGALLALPFAALYPVIENVWLKDYLGRDAIETHRRLQNDSSH